MAVAQEPGIAEAAEPAVSPVSSHNEWDPLEEVVVGRLEGATIPSDHPVVTCNVPPWAARFQGLAAGFRYPRVLVERAQRELDGFVALLQSLGVTVTRPDAVDHRRRFSTPDWSSRGCCNTCPRDCLLVIGDEIIETPMAWPCRYFETHPTARSSGLLPARRALDGRAQAPAHRRAVRAGLPRPRGGRADAPHPHRVRAGLRRGGLRARGTRPLRHPQQRHQPHGHRMAAPPPRPPATASTRSRAAAARPCTSTRRSSPRARQGTGQPGVRRRRPPPGRAALLGHPDRARARPGSTTACSRSPRCAASGSA